jgi:protein DGCR14
MKHLMTWGTLNATPRVLSRSENEELNMTFKIRETSSREALSRKLATSASKNLRAKAEMFGLRTPGISRGSGKVKGDMGPPTRTPRRAEAAGSLTPAAKRLLERSTHGVGGAKRTEGGDLSRVRWTPTPGSRMAG